MCWWHASGDASACADLMQDVLLAMWQRRDSLRSDANEWQERAWVRWQCRSVFSHQDRRRRLPMQPLEEEPADVADGESKRREIEALAVGLTDAEHHVLERILDGYSIGEIALELGIKPASVSQTKYRIIQKMRKEL